LVEYLTDEIQRRAGAYIQEIDDMGGALAAVERGYIQGEIQEAAYQYQRKVESKEQVVVGVNAFKTGDDIDLDPLKVDLTIAEDQRRRLAALRNARDVDRVSELMHQLESSASGEHNLMPLFIECVENYLTLGEICGVLRKVWGEYQPAY
jgi:methylmalonyl-CoA mutase N-terminal domain/subunit